MKDKQKIDDGFSAMVEKDQAELEQAVKEYFGKHWPDTTTAEGCNTQMSFTPPAILRLARHIAGWQYQKDRGEFAKIKAKTWCEGFDAHKEQMLKEAVEADVNVYRDLAEGESWAEFVARMPTQNLGDKVRLVIIKEGEK